LEAVLETVVVPVKDSRFDEVQRLLPEPYSASTALGALARAEFLMSSKI